MFNNGPPISEPLTMTVKLTVLMGREAGVILVTTGAAARVRDQVRKRECSGEIRKKLTPS